MDAKELIGKTITNASFKKAVLSDDEGFLVLEFSDDSTCTIIAAYNESWTGNSAGEYPTKIYIEDGLLQLID
jgi:hypothetical protein